MTRPPPRSSSSPLAFGREQREQNQQQKKQPREKHQRNLDAFFYAKKKAKTGDDDDDDDEEEEDDEDRRGAIEETTPATTTTKMNDIEDENDNSESLGFETENVNAVVERSDEAVEEEKRRRRRREKKSSVLKRWARLAGDALARHRTEGDEKEKNEMNRKRFERLVRVAYAYRCSMKRKKERRRRGNKTGVFGGFSASERGLLEQRRTMHNTVLHGIAERPMYLAGSSRAGNGVAEEGNGEMFNVQMARQFEEFMRMRGVPTMELPEEDEAVEEMITLPKEYGRREGATMRATSQMWLPRDQTAQWMGSVENVFSCVEFDRFSGGKFLACAGGGGTVSVHRTSDVNQKASGGDNHSLLSSIYAPVYKKFVADPVDGILWVKEGVLATVSKRSDRISFHDVERGRIGTASTSPTELSAVGATTMATRSSLPMPTPTHSPGFSAYSQALVVTPAHNASHPSDVSDTLGITSIASCDDGNCLFAATGVGSVFTFDLRQRVNHVRPVSIFSSPTTSALNCVNVTNDGQLVCAASSSGRVVIWDARKAVYTQANEHRGFTGIKPDKELCSWSVSNMFSKIHGRSFASKSEVYWADFDPKDHSRVAFHCSNGRTGVIDIKRNNHATSSLGVITHAHCPPNPWTSTAPTHITQDEAERFGAAGGGLTATGVTIATQTETEEAISSQITKWNGRDKRTCSWSIDGQKLIVPNVNDSGILILDVMANNPKSYQWIDDRTAVMQETRTAKLWNIDDDDDDDDDAQNDAEGGTYEEWEDEEGDHCPGYGHKPIAPPLCKQETILSAVAAHPTCDFEYCAGGSNTLSYFRFCTQRA